MTDAPKTPADDASAQTPPWERDGKPFVVHLSSPTKFWEGLTRVVERPQWLADPRFATKETRGKHYQALHDGLAAELHGDCAARAMDFGRAHRFSFSSNAPSLSRHSLQPPRCPSRDSRVANTA